MVDESQKLSKFQTAVYAEVDMKTAQIRHDAELYKERELERNKDQQLDISYNQIQKKSDEIKKQCKSDVAKFSIEAKHSVLLKRNEITQRVQNNVTKALTEFAKSPEYATYLVKAIQEFSNKYNYSNINIFVCKRDMPLAKQIAEAYKLPCTVGETNEISIGGFIASDEKDGKYFDETFEQKLSEQKAYLIQNSKLDI